MRRLTFQCVCELLCVWLEWVGIWTVIGVFLFTFYLFCRGIVLTYQEHLGVTYIILNLDPSPRMLIHNKCPFPLLLKETVKGKKGKTGLISSHYLSSPLCSFYAIILYCKTFFFFFFGIYFLLSPIETPRTEVHCRPLPANCSLHHELYHHFCSFPECRQKDMLPTLLLKTNSDHCSTDWTDPIDINCPGIQVKRAWRWSEV